MMPDRLTFYTEMHDIASQLVLTWARRGPEHRIDVPGDFTRLTLDSIALCAMGFRFNSFYQEAQHPYVDAMSTVLGAAARSGQEIPILSRFTNTDAKVREARETMFRINQELIEHRRANPTDKKDLLNAMIHSKHPKTGVKMEPKLVAANMSTFLIAGVHILPFHAIVEHLLTILRRPRDDLRSTLLRHVLPAQESCSVQKAAAGSGPRGWQRRYPVTPPQGTQVH